MTRFLASIVAAALTAGVSAAERDFDPQKLKSARELLSATAVPHHELLDPSNQGMKWSLRNVADLGPILLAARGAVADLHVRNPSAVADAYGNGVMTNIEDTLKLFGEGALERGCVSHQSVTFDAVKPAAKDSSLQVKKIRIRTVFQHNAVIVFPKGSDWKQSGVVLDGWIRQKSDLDKMVYAFRKWVGFGDRPRLIDDDE
ncbi:MAG: hypothetical protein AAB036_12155 [Elusimicrobiota bacterium]